MSVRKFYNQIAKDYDRLRFNKKYLIKIDALEKNFILKSVKMKNVLEVGVGTGRFMKLLVSKCDKLTVIDFSEFMLKNSWKKLTTEERKKVNFIKMDLFDLPQLDLYGHFDSIVCMRVLPHVENQKKALKILAGCITKDGNLIFDFWNNHSLYYLGRKMFGKKSRVFTKYISFKEAKKIIQDAKLKIDDFIIWDIPLFYMKILHLLEETPLGGYGYGMIFKCEK